MLYACSVPYTVYTIEASPHSSSQLRPVLLDLLHPEGPVHVAQVELAKVLQPESDGIQIVFKFAEGNDLSDEGG